MSSFVFLSFFMIVVGLPVILGIGSRIYERRLEHKEKMALALSADTAERAAQYAARNERLESRVAVLERILTDRSGHLADEIERLRDAPLN